MKPLYEKTNKTKNHKYVFSHPCGRDDEKTLCNGERFQKHFRRYHRFFIVSPIFWLLVIAYLMYKSDKVGGVGIEWQRVVGFILIFIFIKEVISFVVSRRIYQKILKPIESIRDGLEEVALGNYDVEVDVFGTPEIESLIYSFNKMTGELKNSEEMKRKYEVNRKELIANISHDLKTPITSINGYIDGIVDGVANTPEKIDKYVCIIQQNAKYMNKLIDDLVLYSKLDVQKLDFQFRNINFVDYVSELYDELNLEMQEQGVLMSLDNKIDKPLFMGIDGRHLTRSIRNIVSNGIKYNEKKNPTLIFKLFETNDNIQLCIEDNGQGISKDKLDQIFDRFYRGDDARTSTIGGSGLGLAIAKEIVNAHHGVIHAESELGKGTTICLVFNKNWVSGHINHKEVV